MRSETSAVSAPKGWQDVYVIYPWITVSITSVKMVPRATTKQMVIIARAKRVLAERFVKSPQVNVLLTLLFTGTTVAALIIVNSP